MIYVVCYYEALLCWKVDALKSFRIVFEPVSTFLCYLLWCVLVVAIWCVAAVFNFICIICSFSLLVYSLFYLFIILFIYYFIYLLFYLLFYLFIYLLNLLNYLFIYLFDINMHGLYMNTCMFKNNLVAMLVELFKVELLGICNSFLISKLIYIQWPVCVSLHLFIYLFVCFKFLLDCLDFYKEDSLPCLF